MADPIDLELFLSQLADDELVTDAVMELWFDSDLNACIVDLGDDVILRRELDTAAAKEARRVQAATTRQEAAEQTIDAVIEAVASTPAVTIRETLGAVLEEFLVSARTIDLEALRERDDDR